MKDFFLETLLIDDIQVRWYAFYNLPYYYTEFRNEIHLRPILEELASNENEDIEIHRTLAGCIKFLFESADKNNYEKDFTLIWKLYEILLLKTDWAIIEQNCINLSVCLQYLKKFCNDDTSYEKSPHSV